jgi:hypothetical protein
MDRYGKRPAIVEAGLRVSARTAGLVGPVLSYLAARPAVNGPGGG